jgi:hypothetical protein
MPRVLSEQYEAFENVSATSTGTGNVQTLSPTNKRAIGVWLTVEGSFAARVTFDGSTPGVGVPPGLLIPTGTPPLLFPLAASATLQSGSKVKFASNGAGNSIISAMFVS